MNSFTKTICVQCKVYYGSEERMGMCSVCFKAKDAPKKEEKVEVNPQVQQVEQSLKEPEINDDVKMDNCEVQTKTRPVQTNPHACWVCNKKIGYMGFKCKCEYLFCGSHRHFSDHNCDFDYKNYDREKLNKTNNLGADNKMIK